MYPFPIAPPVSAIGILSPSGTATEYNVGGPPHDIAIGPDGNLWFAGGIIGRISHDGTAAYFAPPATDGAVYFYPWSIVSGPDGNMWFTEFPVAKIGKVSMTGVITEYNLPLPDRQPQYITVGPDGALWFTANETYPSLAQFIERFTTSGQLTEYVSPTIFEGEARIATGSDGNLWFTEPGGVNAPYSNVVRFTTAGSFSVFGTPTPAAGPTGIAPGPDGNIWFTEALASQIGRVAIGQIGSCESSATVLCADDLRFKIEAQWQKPNDPAPSPGNAITLTNNTGYFWFFDPANIELVTKVLNGCSTNGHYWFFAAGLTNVGVQINVTDTVTGTSKPYSNTLGTAFPPIQDTAAFPCP
jgi:streptogramin lyase